MVALVGSCRQCCPHCHCHGRLSFPALFFHSFLSILFPFSIFISISTAFISFSLQTHILSHTQTMKLATGKFCARLSFMSIVHKHGLTSLFYSLTVCQMETTCNIVFAKSICINAVSRANSGEAYSVIGCAVDMKSFQSAWSDVMSRNGRPVIHADGLKGELRRKRRCARSTSGNLMQQMCLLRWSNSKVI